MLIHDVFKGVKFRKDAAAHMNFTYPFLIVVVGFKILYSFSPRKVGRRKMILFLKRRDHLLAPGKGKSQAADLAFDSAFDHPGIIAVKILCRSTRYLNPNHENLHQAFLEKYNPAAASLSTALFNPGFACSENELP
jgi:hypothetical protein